MRPLKSAFPFRSAPRLQEGADLAMLAHDIRGALQCIQGGLASIDIAGMPLSLQEQLRRIAVGALAIERLTVLLANPAPGEPEDNVVTWFAHFVPYLRERWSGEIAASGRRFEFAPSDLLPAGVQVPCISLGRIVGNLVSNALNHGTGAIRLEMARSGSGGVVLTVVNGGPPIDGSVLAEVLGEEVVALRAPHEEHGLGLHIVRTLADEIGATFHIFNRPDGVEARLEIGADRVLLEGAPEFESEETAPASGGQSLAGVRILLAEDNPTNQMVAVQMLGMLGADVTLAGDGVDAIDAFELAPFDLVVVDIEMPRMSGLDVIRTIRSRRDERARTPIVALTAYAMNEHRDRIAEAGANGLISKPIASIEALSRALVPHLGHGGGAAQPPAPPAGAAEAASDKGVVDHAIYDSLAEAIGAEMMSELLEKVIADLSNSRRDLVSAEKGLERGPIRSASHILISVAGAIGATRLQLCARALNNRAHSGENDGLADLLRQCLGEIDAAVAYASAQRAAH